MSTNMSKNSLIEETIKLNKGLLTNEGALVVETGEFTGRAAKHRYVVRHPESENQVNWGKVNKPLDLNFANQYFSSLEDSLQNIKTYTMKANVGCFPVEVTSTSPWHIAFAQNMFRDSAIKSVVDQIKTTNTNKTIRIFHSPYSKPTDYVANAKEFIIGDTLIAVNLEELKVGIVGTAYAGEIKKSAFSMCNFLMPQSGIFPMHSSANCEKDGSNASILFGLSGTGKTTLSADPDRALIGDDEIIWSDNGLSNLEGGCYAKLINLSKEKEPEIFNAVHKTGSILENVSFDQTTKSLDFDDGFKTENTRGSYDISALNNVFEQNTESHHPKTIIFLTADAFGALPAVAKLDPWQTQYHFMSGYTAKVAGTELGVTEPTTAFSACFGEPFMPLHPSVYAKLLAKKAAESGATVWLLNTGWVGGCEKGQRFPITVSRQLLTAIQSGELEKQPMTKHPVFGFDVPTTCPGVEEKWLQSPTGPEVNQLATQFVSNFTKFADATDVDVMLKGGPLMNVTTATATERSTTTSL